MIYADYINALIEQLTTAQEEAQARSSKLAGETDNFTRPTLESERTLGVILGFNEALSIAHKLRDELQAKYYEG